MEMNLEMMQNANNFDARAKRRKSKEQKRKNVAVATGKQITDLPANVLELILDRLGFSDVTVFGRVCRVWRDLVLHYTPRFSRAPWLWIGRFLTGVADVDLLEDDMEDDSMPTIKIKLPKRITCAANYLGSSGGWILVSISDPPEFILWNPMSNHVVTLPESVKLPDGSFERLPAEPLSSSFFFAHIYTVPTLPFPGVVVFVMDVSECLYGWKPGDDLWMGFEFGADILQIATTLDEGTKFLGLGAEGGMWSIDLALPSITYFGRNTWASIDEIGYFDPFFCTARSLEQNGDVYLVHFKKGPYHTESNFFSLSDKDLEKDCLIVKRLDLPTMEWHRIYELGDCALFVSMPGSMMIPFARKAGFRSNCVYLLYPDVNKLYIYDMADRSFTSYCNVWTTGLEVCSQDGFWFTPTIPQPDMA